MTDLFGVDKTLDKIGRFIVEKLREELFNQGHKATGELIHGIKYDIVKGHDGFTLNVTLHDKYGIFVNNGVTAGRIPYSRGSGAKSSMYINALIGWIQQKGLESGDRDIKNFAFAIANKHKKEGMPTSGSLKYSRNGRRTGFIDRVIEDNEDGIEMLAERETFEVVEVFFDNLVRNANRK